MHAPATKILLGKANIGEAQALRTKLSGHGIEIALIHNSSTCSSGCAVQVEIWAHPADAEEIARLLGEDRRQVYLSMGYDPSLAEAVFDPEQAAATCPACGATFATTSQECPECGLGFAVPDDGGGCGSGGCS